MHLTTFNDAATFEVTFRKPFLALLPDDLTDEQVAREEQWFVKHLETIRWRPCLIVEMQTGLDNLRQVVFDRVQAVADFWQFCVGTIMRGEWIPIVDYRLTSLLRGIEVFPVVATDQSIIDLPTLPGGAPAVILTSERMTWLGELGLIAIVDIFGAPDGDVGDGFDALLRRSIQNYADGERATSQRQKLLSYTAAAELFFTREKDTTTAVCHGIAKILAEELSLPYNKLYGQADAMYEARSRTIHDGVAPSGSDVTKYSAVSQNVILAMVKRRGTFADLGAIAAWSDPPPPRSHVCSQSDATDD